MTKTKDKIANLTRIASGLDLDDRSKDAEVVGLIKELLAAGATKADFRVATRAAPMLMVIMLRRMQERGVPLPADLTRQATELAAELVADGSVTAFTMLLQHSGALRDAGDEQAAIQVGTVWVEVAKVCQAVGLSLKSQLRTLKAHPWARLRVTDGVASIPLTSAPMWLARVHVDKVKPDLRAAFEHYQADARDELADALGSHPFVLKVTGGRIPRKPAAGVDLVRDEVGGGCSVHPFLCPMVAATTDVTDVTPAGRPAIDGYQRDAAAALATKFLRRKAA